MTNVISPSPFVKDEWMRVDSSPLESLSEAVYRVVGLSPVPSSSSRICVSIVREGWS